MDPPTMNDTDAMNTAQFNLSDIWSIQMRAGPFGPNFDSFMEPAPNRQVCESGGAADAGVVRRRTENNALQDDSDKTDSDGKRLKTSGSGDDCKNSKAEREASSGKGTEQKMTTPPEPLKDYIHVRARRGQATDSHSLAERARREKISERMRILQDLVPGCNKVIGKALVLDEIINYVQSLQRQVEFLSMKLEAVSSRITPGLEGFPLKDVSISYSLLQIIKLDGSTFQLMESFPGTLALTNQSLRLKSVDAQHPASLQAAFIASAICIRQVPFLLHLIS